VRAWIEAEPLWSEGEQYVVVPKAEGTHCPALIQVDLSTSKKTGNMQMHGTMNDQGTCDECKTRYCEHTKEEVMRWLREFLNDDV